MKIDQSDLNNRTKAVFHVYINLNVIAFLLIGSGIGLWYMISQFWLWLLIFPFWVFVLLFLSHRLVPRLTNRVIEQVFKDKWDPDMHIPFKVVEPWELIHDGDAFVSELKKRSRP